MKTRIFHYSGTGNSLWVAQILARELDNSELVAIAEGKPVKDGEVEALGLVFPVHIWGVPRRILQFVQMLEGMRTAYLFAIAVNAGQVANTLVQLKAALKKCGRDLSLGFEIPMPSNYIPWGGPGPRDRQIQKFAAAQRKISGIAQAVKRREEKPVEMGPIWQRILFTLIYKMSFSQVPKMDRKFWVDEKCDHCSVCARLCPSGNITLQEGKPSWNHRCEQCFACLQWCPEEAIQYGKKTPRYERYHHPEIALKDFLRERPPLR